MLEPNVDFFIHERFASEKTSLKISTTLQCVGTLQWFVLTLKRFRMEHNWQNKALN